MHKTEPNDNRQAYRQGGVSEGPKVNNGDDDEELARTSFRIPSALHVASGQVFSLRMSIFHRI